MAYIGNTPAEAFSAFQKQDFTTSATTSYTLDHPVSNQNEIALFINFVRQEPTAAYTASGTTLTLTSATSSSDDMYCVYLGKAVQTVNPASGSVGSSQVAASIITGQTAETSIATDDTILIHDTSASALKKMTRANFVSGIGGTNTPMFFLNKTDTQSISNNTTTKVTFNSELIDTDSAVSSSTFTVPSGEAGKYFFVFTVTADSTTDTDYLTPYLYHQGGVYARNIMRSPGTGSLTGIVSGIIDLSVGETVEAYVRQNTGGSINISGESAEKRTTFTGYKLIT